jgi:hypothetical protein
MQRVHKVELAVFTGVLLLAGIAAVTLVMTNNGAGAFYLAQSTATASPTVSDEGNDLAAIPEQQELPNFIFQPE